MDTPWSKDPANNLPFAGSSVEAFLKKNIRNKVGFAKVVISADGQNDLIAGFENEDAYDTWNALSTEDKWGEAGAAYLLTYDALPSPKKDSYAVSLVFRETPATTQASTDVSVAMKGTSIVSWAAGGSDQIQEDLLVTVQTRASSSAAWATRESFTIPANTEDYIVVSLAKYLNNGANYIRFRAEGEYATSLWSSFTLNVVALQLVPNTPFSVPFAGNVLSLNYLVGGSIAKTLQFEFGTGMGTTFEAQYSYLNNDPGCSRSLGTATNLTTGITFTFEDPDMNEDIMADGVHTVRARLFVSESVKTDWIESQYMVANGVVSPMVIVNNIASKLDNWTDVVFFDWAAHTAGQNEMTVIFRLVDSADDTIEYARWSQTRTGTSWPSRCSSPSGTRRPTTRPPAPTSSSRPPPAPTPRPVRRPSSMPRTARSSPPCGPVSASPPTDGWRSRRMSTTLPRGPSARSISRPAASSPSSTTRS